MSSCLTEGFLSRSPGHQSERTRTSGLIVISGGAIGREASPVLGLPSRVRTLAQHLTQPRPPARHHRGPAVSQDDAIPRELVSLREEIATSTSSISASELG